MLGREECVVYVHERWSSSAQAALAQRGIEVNPEVWIPPLPKHRHLWGYHLVRIPYGQLGWLAADANVVRIASAEISHRPTNDFGRAAIFAKQVYDGQGIAAKTGAGVKVCIADTGLDTALTDLPTPVEAKDVTDGDTLASWGNDVSNHISGHGTHVVGSVLGNGGYSGGKYRGAAPGASLYFYKIANDTNATSTVADEVKAIQRAQVVNCKIFSMSFGLTGIDVDGSDAMEQAIDVASAAGMTVFISAGNDGSAKLHWSIGMPPGSSTNFNLGYTNKGSTTDSQDIGVCVHWRDATPGDANLSLTEAGLGAVANSPYTTPRGTESRCGLITHTTIPGGSFSLAFTLANAANGDATIAHVFAFGSEGNIALNKSTPANTIGSPAVADTAIAVGSYVSRESWTDSLGSTQAYSGLNAGEMASYSAYGPRIDGLLKPDITSAGSAIISLSDSNVAVDPGTEVDDDGQTLDGSGPTHYRVSTGTSMATPLAAGAAALLLQTYPNATRDYVYWALTTTAQDVQIAAPDMHQGNGLIDIRAAILAHSCGDGVVAGDEQCDDGNNIDTDCCGSCVLTNICDDGDGCTNGEYCTAGKCGNGTPKVCADDSLCTADTCVAPLGFCLHLPANFGGSCNDGDPCTDVDKCNGIGSCHGTAVVCDDGNPCTTDACQGPNGKCNWVANTSPCDDGLLCTLNDVCGGGACHGAADTCDDSDPCTHDSCDASLGCQNVQHHDACDDGDACTQYDSCNSFFKCKGVPMACWDGLPCTTDACIGGTCVFKDVNCADGDPCTTDLCDAVAGGCYSTPKSCLDTNACTTDSCDAKSGECMHVPLDGTPCADPSWCTKADTCVAGMCVGTPIVCSDGNPCTDDSCYEGNGTCWFQPKSGSCEDGNFCTTGDTCSNGTCTGGGAMNCDDGNPCTSDLCDKLAAKCTHGPLIASNPPCDDNDVCTELEYCDNGACVGGIPTNCSDGSPCTIDSCLVGVGCAHVAGGNGCDDANPCTVDACDVQGACTHTANSAGICTDGNFCTTDEHCVGTTCVSQPTSCDDANSCTSDSCGYVQGNPAGACVHVLVTGACEDGDACTVGDTCAGSTCVAGGSTLDCTDGEPCTLDLCKPASGCIHPSSTTFCDDGDPCTYDEMCIAGFCVGQVIAGCGVDAADTTDADTVLGEDAAADAAVDGPADVSQDADDAIDAVADVVIDTAPDIAVDAAADAAAETGSDVAADAAPEVAIDIAPDGKADVKPDATADSVPDVGDVHMEVEAGAGTALDAPGVIDGDAGSADALVTPPDSLSPASSPCSASRRAAPLSTWLGIALAACFGVRVRRKSPKR